MTSVTTEIKAQKAKWFDNDGNFLMIDVPGFGDSQGNDQKYMDALFKEIKNLGQIDKFILVIKRDRLNS